MATKAEEERLAKIATDLEKLQSQGFIPVPIYDENGVLVGYTAQQTAVLTATSVSPSGKASTNRSSFKAGKELPETGEAESFGTVALGGILTLFGLVGASKSIKRKH